MSLRDRPLTLTGELSLARAQAAALKLEVERLTQIIRDFSALQCPRECDHSCPYQGQLREIAVLAVGPPKK